jgi:hypothetical protein
MGGKTLPVGRQELPEAGKALGPAPSPIRENNYFSDTWKTAGVGTQLAMT